MDLNFERMLIAFILGILFSQMGSVTQVAWRNHLASPSTLGIDGIAVLIYLLTFFNFGLWLLPFLLVGIWFFAGKSTTELNESNTDKLIIMGMALNLAVGAIFSILQFFVIALNIDFPSQVWFGQIRWVTLEKIYLVLAVFILWNLFILKKRKFLILESLHPKFTKLFFINPNFEKKLIWFMLLIINFMIVYYFGVFSFLSLVFPHFLRFFKIFNTSITKELFIGPLFCGVFLMVLDQLAWQFPLWGVEIPVGLMASILGSIGLMILLIQKFGQNLGKTH